MIQYILHCSSGRAVHNRIYFGSGTMRNPERVSHGGTTK